MQHGEDRLSLYDLLGRLATDLSNLFRKEIELAKQEAWEKVSGMLQAAQLLAAGCVLAIAATGVLLAAAVSGLAAVFVAFGMEQSAANGLSAAIVAMVFGGIAWALIASAISTMRTATTNFDRTLGSLSQDAAVVAETLDVKH